LRLPGNQKDPRRVGKTEAPRQLNSEIKERLAAAIQIHAADFDAGLAALQAADPLTTSVTQIAFCGSADRVALALRKEHRNRSIKAAVPTGRCKPLIIKRDSNLREAASNFPNEICRKQTFADKLPCTIWSCFLSS
jgi:hypothetical protein